MAWRGLLGDGAPLSASSIGRLTAKWQAECEQWQSQSLASLEVVYLWVDGIYVKAGLEKEKACILVALAGLSMVTFYHLPKEHWLHLRTSNPVESPFSAVRLRTEASRHYKKVQHASPRPSADHQSSG